MEILELSREAGAGTLGALGLRSLWRMGAQRGSSESSHHRGSPESPARAA
jgi:hypothetical protein